MCPGSGRSSCPPRKALQMSRALLAVVALGVFVGCGDDDEVADPPVADASVADAARELDAKTPALDGNVLADAQVDAASGSCRLDQRYQFGFIGGNAIYHDAHTLDASGELTKQRADTGRAGPNDAGPLRQCVVTLPPCGSDAVDLADLTAALTDANVVGSWATAPNLFGVDPRPYDGQILVIARTDGKVIEIGDACEQGADCRLVTPALDALRTVFARLVQQTSESPACANL
jgi:hypothetical protein